MTKSHFFILFIASFIITSCALHSGNINNAQVPQSSKGIVYKDKVYGYASCYYVFGIGGAGSQGLAAEAVFNMKSGVELEAGEYLDHFTIDHRRFYFLPFYMQHEVLVTADKIKDLDGKKVLYDEEYTRQNENFETKEKNFFYLNEKVFIQNTNGVVSEAQEATIIKHLKGGVKVISMNKYGRIERKRVRYSNVFKKDAKGNLSFFLSAKKGDTVGFKESLYSNSYYKKGVFLGSNNSKLLIKDLNSPESYAYNFRNIIIEDSTEERRKQLNQEIIYILKTKSNQKLIGKTSNNKIIKGNFIGFDGDDVVIQLEDSNEEITIDISNVYTHENWLEFGNKRPNKINTKVIYKKKYVVEEPAEILGYRYHRVLIKTDNGEILDVPVGKIQT